MLQVAALLPINALRNAAMLMADTPLVLPMDMDMLINRELNALAGDPKRRAHVAPNRKDTRPDRVLWWLAGGRFLRACRGLHMQAL